MAPGQSNYDGPKSCYVNFPRRPKFEAGAASHGGVYPKVVNSSPFATFREAECRCQHIWVTCYSESHLSRQTLHKDSH